MSLSIPGAWFQGPLPPIPRSVGAPVPYMKWSGCEIAQPGLARRRLQGVPAPHCTRAHSAQCSARGKFSFCFWELSGIFFFLTLFDLWLVDSTAAKPTDTRTEQLQVEVAVQPSATPVSRTFSSPRTEVLSPRNTLSILPFSPSGNPNSL